MTALPCCSAARAYLAQLAAAPGTYFQSAGWLENAEANIRQPEFTFGPNSNVTRERLIERYGEDNADYLLGQFYAFTRHYERLAYIATGCVACVGRPRRARPPPSAIGNSSGSKAISAGLRRLVDGEWSSEEFLTLRPGERVALTHDDRLIGAEPA